MKPFPTRLFAATLLCLASACSSGGSGAATSQVSTDPSRQLVVDCTAEGVQRVLQTVLGYVDLAVQANDPSTPFPVSQITIPPGDVRPELDADGDGVLETVVLGTLRQPFRQIFDGVQAGEGFTIDFTTSGLFGMTGVLTFQLSDQNGPLRYEVTGSLEVTRGLPCLFSVARLDLDVPLSGGPRVGASAGDPLGVIEIQATSGVNTLSGLATVVPGGDIDVAAQDLSGALNFQVDGGTFQPFAVL